MSKPGESVPKTGMERIGVWGIVAAFLVLLGIFVLDVWRSREAQDSFEWIVHTREVQGKLWKLLSALDDAETGQRGFLLTGDPAYLEPFANVQDKIRNHVADMEAEEGRLLAERNRTAEEAINLNLLVNGVGFVAVILIAIVVIRKISHAIAVRSAAGEALRKRSIELEAVTKELDTFAYSVSHDLRSPLRGIGGFSQALIEDHAEKLDGQALDYLQRIAKGAVRMGQMIDDILTLSRATRQELQSGQVNLSKQAQDILDELYQSDPDRNVSTTVAPDVMVRGDERLLQIVLENLLGNAWKFTSHTETAQIEFGVYVEGGEQVYFVQDNGAGFDMAYKDKLFGVFQRLHSMSEFEGTGIGLATVARLINRHGGRVWAEAEVGKGARIFFTLET